MCDVCGYGFSLRWYSSWPTQVCKYPEKTKLRKLSLSSEGYLLSQASKWQKCDDDDDERGNIGGGLANDDELDQASKRNSPSRETSRVTDATGQRRVATGTKRPWPRGIDERVRRHKASPVLGKRLFVLVLLTSNIVCAVTKPSKSAHVLTKPFKVPLLKRHPEVVLRRPHAEIIESSISDIIVEEIAGERNKALRFPAHSAVPPDVDIEPHARLSQKISVRGCCAY
jgi:hypothetical protein